MRCRQRRYGNPCAVKVFPCNHGADVDGRRLIRDESDIASSTEVFDRMEHRITVAETDQGHQLQERVNDLRALLLAYKSGAVTEDHTK